MNDVKCECRHVNPYGTVLCEACGKILDDSGVEYIVHDMRYEGSARRSQVYRKTIIDKIWNFFSSVKVGIWIIIFTLIASSLGTILPQEMYIPPVVDPAAFYADQYGWFGRLYYNLGFHNLYSSWWYLLLIASLGISLVICSLDRVIPLYRALNNQSVIRHIGFLKRQRLFGFVDKAALEGSLDLIKIRLLKNKYKIREENGSILAEKGRFSRWGPYINHVGLIIFLIGGMLRFVPGMYIDKILWLREGETKVIPETDGEYYLQNNRFIFEVYNKENDKEVFQEAIDRVGIVAKNYQTNVTLYKKTNESVPGEKPDLTKVKDYPIQVNKPLKFEGFALYQVDYKLNELNKMSFTLTNKATKQEYGNITVDLFNPKMNYDLNNDYRVEIISYFPDFEFDSEGEPATKSRIPNNPAFVFKIYTPNTPDGEISFVAIQQTIETHGDNQYKMTFSGIETKNVSALTVRKDLTLWILGIGGVIFMIGVVQGAYWNHRRIWIHYTDKETMVAAHTNKNWYGLQREIEKILEETEIEPPKDKLQN